MRDVKTHDKTPIHALVWVHERYVDAKERPESSWRIQGYFTKIMVINSVLKWVLDFQITDFKVVFLDL